MNFQALKRADKFYINSSHEGDCFKQSFSVKDKNGQIIDLTPIPGVKSYDEDCKLLHGEFNKINLTKENKNPRKTTFGTCTNFNYDKYHYRLLNSNKSEDKQLLEIYKQLLFKCSDESEKRMRDSPVSFYFSKKDAMKIANKASLNLESLNIKKVEFVENL